MAFYVVNYFGLCSMKTWITSWKFWVILIGEAGWTPDQYGYSRVGILSASTENGRKHLTAFMRSLIKASLRSFYLNFD